MYLLSTVHWGLSTTARCVECKEYVCFDHAENDPVHLCKNYCGVNHYFDVLISTMKVWKQNPVGYRWVFLYLTSKWGYEHTEDVYEQDDYTNIFNMVKEQKHLCRIDRDDLCHVLDILNVVKTDVRKYKGFRSQLHYGAKGRGPHQWQRWSPAGQFHFDLQ